MGLNSLEFLAQIFVSCSVIIKFAIKVKLIYWQLKHTSTSICRRPQKFILLLIILEPLNRQSEHIKIAEGMLDFYITVCKPKVVSKKT